MSICFSIFDCNSVSSSTQFITSSHWTCLNTFCLVVLLRLLLHWQTENCVFLSFLEETEEEFGFLHEQHGQRKSMLEVTTVQDSLTSKLGVFIGPLEAMSYLCSVHLCWVESCCFAMSLRKVSTVKHMETLHVLPLFWILLLVNWWHIRLLFWCSLSVLHLFRLTAFLIQILEFVWIRSVFLEN